MGKRVPNSYLQLNIKGSTRLCCAYSRRQTATRIQARRWIFIYCTYACGQNIKTSHVHYKKREKLEKHMCGAHVLPYRTYRTQKPHASTAAALTFNRTLAKRGAFMRDSNEEHTMRRGILGSLWCFHFGVVPEIDRSSRKVSFAV